MKHILIGVLAFTAAAAQTPAASQHESLFPEIEGISRSLEEITGLKFKHKVAAAVLDKDQLRKFLTTRIDKTMRPADIKAESLILKMLGLIPGDFDLRGQTVDLLTEQAAAFYDYQRKKLFLMQGDTGEAALMALAHELAHALADQNFHLEKYIKQNSQSDDAATARMAVMEGQATWLMSAYLHQRAGLGVDIPPVMMQMMSTSLEQGASQFPVFSQSPLYIRESLIFPYRGGLLFQDAVYRKLGKDGFAEVFRRAPVSSQQIFHPERYLENEGPKLPQVPVVPEAKQFRKLAEGTLGEFDYRVLLVQYGAKDRAEALAASLLGSQFVLFEDKKDEHPVLAFASRWKSEAESREFWTFYRQALKAKSKTFEPGEESGTMFSGHTEAGFFRVTRKDDVVESIEGLKTSVN